MFSRSLTGSLCDPEVFSKLFHTKPVTAEDIIEKLSICNEQQKDLEERTRGQSLNDVWFAKRQNRITGSKCGCILQQKQKTAALLQSTIYSKPFTLVPVSSSNTSTHFWQTCQLSCIACVTRTFAVHLTLTRRQA